MSSALSMTECRSAIEAAYQNAAENPSSASTALGAIEETLRRLDRGEWRVVEKVSSNGTHDEWVVNEWIKKAILLYFRVRKMGPIEAGDLRFNDKVPLKTWHADEGVRVVPPAVARYGSFIAPGAILMPSFVNIGARVGAGTMVDTWATVGSCAYIGTGVHLSGGVGIGGVLEPVQARPVIIEDHAFIGSRCIVVEGVHVEAGAVLGAGVTITSSTKIIDVTTPEAKTYQGRVPKNAVVIPGSYAKDFAAGTYQVPCALIIGSRKASTNEKTSLTDALREYGVAT